jgi:nitrite reductase/ring-hydroxylating ferredoxin subunit
VTNTVVKRVKAVKASKSRKRVIGKDKDRNKDAVRSGVVTDHGTISAEHVIIATHVPLGRIPALLPWEQRRHHVAAIEVDAEVPMSYDIDNGWSTRPAPRGDGQRPRAVVLGGRHAIGDDDSHYAGELHRWATTEMSGTVISQWSTQDVFTDDELPIVGGVKPRDSVLTATGFGGWGFAHGTAAGIDLAQRVHSGEDRWGFWSPSTERLTKLIPQATKRGVQASTELVAERIKRAASHVDDADIEPGQGVIVREGTSYVAKSRDQGGRLAAVNATCTHLGCLVAWNNVSQSWDCPCHGSRYDRYGHVLHGPATKPLDRVADEGIDLAAGTEAAWDR